MQPLGNTAKPERKGLSLRMGSVGMAIMLVVFLVAVVFASNQNDVVGWLVVIVSLGWLLIFSFVVFSLRSAARKAGARINEFNRTTGGGTGTGTYATDNSARDLKLDHSFKIVQVQVRVVRDNLGQDQDMVDRALETIEITSHNARSMMKRNDDDGPVEGTVVG
nr:hypothetical protein [Arthrobacter sp. H5]